MTQHQKNNPVSLKKMRRLMWLMGVVQIPMIAYTKPRLQHLDDHKAIVTIKLRRRTKNHLKSMYFGALAVGADVAAGIHAYYFAKKSNAQISFAFKSVNGQFLQRATSTISFESVDGKLVEQTFEKALSTGERVNQMVMVNAFNTAREIVATFEMEISVKVKSKK